jgi:hypothetical protein
LADVIDDKDVNAENIIPSAFDRSVAVVVADAVREIAEKQK